MDKKTRDRVAPTRCSEHQSGLAIDIASLRYGYILT